MIVLPKDFIDYGNYVFFVDACGEDFGKSLAAFRKARPHLRIVAVAPDSTLRGQITGYWVICEEHGEEEV